MRDGPPPWLHPPALVTSDSYPVDDGHIRAEIWAGGIRFFADGFAEDDGAWDHEAWSTYMSLAEAVCLCNTLALAKDTHFDEEAWGRVYRRVFSLDSHTGDVETNPQKQFVWFYPMTERRLVFRLLVGPLVPALSELMSWALGEVDLVQAEDRATQRRLIHRAMTLLEEAGHRVRMD